MNRPRVVSLVSVLVLVLGFAVGTMALAQDNSETTITVDFSDDCTSFDVFTDPEKDISHVSIDTDGNWSLNNGGNMVGAEFTDNTNSPTASYGPEHYTPEPGVPVTVQVKSGNTSELFECNPGCPDTDGDGACDDEDNCPDVANSDQTDTDGDGVGDACDTEGPPGDPSCDDGIDNDGDGLIDGDDPDCQEEEGPPGDPTCDDGIDNDGDGLIDLEDPDCQETQAQQLNCRASLVQLLGVEPFDTGTQEPCGNADAGLVYQVLSALGLTGSDIGGFIFFTDDGQVFVTDGSTGAIFVDLLYARTDGNELVAHSESGVARVAIFTFDDEGGVEEVIGLDALTSESTQTCERMATDATVLSIRLAGNEISITGGHTVIPADPLANIHLEDGADNDGNDEGPDDSGAQALDLEALAAAITAAVADSETGCS